MFFIIMLKRILFIMLLGALFISPSAYLHGAPAIKSPVRMTLPDQTTLTVYLQGDEFFNYASTEDGYLIVKNESGFYEYALSDDEGNFVRSEVVARDANRRSEREIQYLSTLSKGLSERQQEQRNKKREDAKRQLLRATEAIQEHPTIGTLKSLILLVEYQDVRFSHSHERMDRFFNEIGYSDDGAAGSAKDFYHSTSDGQYDPEFVVVGPITLPYNMDYYGGEGKPANQMITHGCKIAKEELGLDFSQFDTNNDGEVDVVYCFFAGYDRAQGGPANSVWSHASGIGGVSYDGKRIGKYACSSELRGNSGTNLVGCGTFVHEFGHVLGLPDMYETDGANNGICQTPGNWTTMASGGYNDYGRSPALYSAYERHILNWLNLDDYLLNLPGEYELDPLISSNKAYKIETKTPGDFYILEYRTKTGFDSFLADQGLLIWHIDRSNTPIRHDGSTTTPASLWNRGTINNIGGHPLYDIIESVPIQPTQTTPDNRNVVFPGNARKTSFTDTSTPNMKSWAGENTEKPVTNIRIESNKVLFDLIAPPDITDNGGIVTSKYDIKPEDASSDPAKLIDNDVATYYSRLVLNADSYWVQYQSSKQAVVTKYGLTSSDGVAERDPKSWTLKASNDGESWVDLDARSNESFSGRKELNVYKFENDVPYIYYRLEVTELNGGAGFQLAEWELFGYQEPDSPSEVTAVWGKTSIHVDLSWKDNSIGEIGFEIERSENGIDFESIQQVSANNTTYMDTSVEHSKRYYYRIKAVMDGINSAWSDVVEVCTDLNIATNENGIASSEYEVKPADPTSDPKMLFDENVTTKYYRLSLTANSYWMQYQSNQSASISGYAITSAGEIPACNPKAWTLSGSVDGEDWVLLDTQEDQVFSGIECKTYEINTNSVYSYFRLNVTELNGSRAIEIADWEIFGRLQEGTQISNTSEKNTLYTSTLVSLAHPWVIEGIESYPKNAVTIYSISGIKVFSQKGYANNWVGSGLQDGVYLYEVNLGDANPPQRGRLIVKN